jgi:glycosyltransferase involved in cell wall biosynthesis
MRVALIRGSLVGPWELPNYLIDGVDVEVIASKGGGGDGSSPLPVRELRSPAELLSRLPPLASGVVDLTVGSVQYLWGLEDALEGFDIAHAGEIFMPMTLQACEARDRGRCRRVVASVMENIPFHPDQNRWVRKRIGETARRVDRFIAMSERARLHLELHGVDPARVVVLPVGTDVERFGPAPLPRDDGQFRVLSVARLEPGKGVEDLAIAVGLLAARGVDVRASFYGRGPSRGRLERITADMGVADRVEFPGFVPWRELHEVYRRHDAFVLASATTRNWREQLGFAVLEAMASGLPVLVGDSGSLPEVVGRPESLVRPHDPPALADALEELAGDPALRAARGQWNRARVLERYDQRRVREQLGALYREVLAG